jgi:hypothetical protein
MQIIFCGGDEEIGGRGCKKTYYLIGLMTGNKVIR